MRSFKLDRRSQKPDPATSFPAGSPTSYPGAGPVQKRSFWARMRISREPELRGLESAQEPADQKESELTIKPESAAPEPPAEAPGPPLAPATRAVPGYEEPTIREAAERQALERLEEIEREQPREQPQPLTEPEQPGQRPPPEPSVAPAAAGGDPAAWRTETALAEAEADRMIELARSERPPPPVEEPEPAPAEEPPAEEPPVPTEPAIDEPSPPPPVVSAEGAETMLAELARTESELDARRGDEQRLAAELEQAEFRVTETQRRTAEAIERAAAQLEQVEARAREAEERAERAERLARMRGAEAEQAGQLREMLERISLAEERASSAELRARAAVDRIGEPEPGFEPGADA